MDTVVQSALAMLGFHMKNFFKEWKQSIQILKLMDYMKSRQIKYQSNAKSVDMSGLQLQEVY